MTTDLLFCTPSGMARVMRDDAPEPVRDAVALFSVSNDEMVAIARLSGINVADNWLEQRTVQRR